MVYVLMYVLSCVVFTLHALVRDMMSGCTGERSGSDLVYTLCVHVYALVCVCLLYYVLVRVLVSFECATL